MENGLENKSLKTLINSSPNKLWSNIRIFLIKVYIKWRLISNIYILACLTCQSIASPENKVWLIQKYLYNHRKSLSILPVTYIFKQTSLYSTSETGSPSKSDIINPPKLIHTPSVNQVCLLSPFMGVIFTMSSFGK